VLLRQVFQEFRPRRCSYSARPSKSACCRLLLRPLFAIVLLDRAADVVPVALPADGVGVG
jgi:hypothetical protein